MKLYTESEVRKAIELARDTHPEGRGYMQREEYDYSMDEVFDLLTPIELPSDFEIWKEGHEEMNIGSHNAFSRGAKWMRDKIKGGNNEQQ
jgi:hypothetical protein